MTRAPRRLSARRLAVAALAAVLVPTAAFVLLEGGSSLVLLAQDARARPDEAPLARLRHTRYDPELGWAHVPGVRIDDLYGPGAWLQTNGQGFRAERDFSQHVPAGRLRAICSGDSFTLGYGVANDQTWCARLEALDPRFETVNMGQGGYGIDQAWLWYRRDGTRLDHDVHVFAFISDDFRRMQAASFLGYAKPVLALRGGELVVLNTPVPRRRFYAAWLARLESASEGLRTTELVRRLRGRPRAQRPPPAGAPAPDDAAVAVVRKLLDALAAENRAKESQLVLAYLPTPADWKGSESDGWRRVLEREARERGLPYLDLVAALRRLPAQEVEALFIRPGVLAYRAAAGHLTPKGNAWVAEQVHATLAAQPSIAARLRALEGTAAQDAAAPGGRAVR
jgi:hypothetical protein